MAGFVEPFGEGLGELGGFRRGAVGYGDGEVVDGDVFLGCADDVDLRHCVKAGHWREVLGDVPFRHRVKSPHISFPSPRA